MAIRERLLGQLRPVDDTAVSIYSPASDIIGIIKTITVANTSAGVATYRIFHDDDGNTFDQSTALYYDISLAVGATDLKNLFIAMDDARGNLAVRTNTGNALTFTIYGYEVTQL